MKPKNNDERNFYECCDLTKKVYLTTASRRALKYNIDAGIASVVVTFFSSSNWSITSPLLKHDEYKLEHIRKGLYQSYYKSIHERKKLASKSCNFMEFLMPWQVTNVEKNTAAASSIFLLLMFLEIIMKKKNIFLEIVCPFENTFQIVKAVTHKSSIVDIA